MVLREAYFLRKDDEPKQRIEKLHEIHKEIQENSILTNGTIDHLIRDKLIPFAAAEAAAGWP